MHAQMFVNIRILCQRKNHLCHMTRRWGRDGTGRDAMPVVSREDALPPVWYAACSAPQATTSTPFRPRSPEAREFKI